MKTLYLICFLGFALKSSAQNFPVPYLDRKTGKYGLMDSNSIHQIYVNAKYDSINSFIGDLFTIYKNGKIGLIYPSGKIFLPCEYDKIYFLPVDKSLKYLGNILVYANKNNMVTIYDLRKRIQKNKTYLGFIPYSYKERAGDWDYFEDVKMNYYKKIKNITGLLGISVSINNKFEHDSVIISPQYDSIGEVYNFKLNNTLYPFFVVKKNNQYGIINEQNIQLVPIANYKIYYDYDRLYFSIVDEKNHKWGLFVYSDDSTFHYYPPNYTNIGKEYTIHALPNNNQPFRPALKNRIYWIYEENIPPYLIDIDTGFKYLK